MLGEELGAEQVFLTTSCSHALEMAALLLDLRPGDEVIVPSFTFVTSASSFLLRGARPVFVDVRPAGSEHRVQLFQCGDLLLGCTEEPFVAEELAARTQSLYQRILKVTRGRHLYRIWNYLPDINRLTAALENYRAFCQGRSLAFEATLGGQFQPQLPAASEP